MHYRPLGRTGLTVSQLGFGAMRLPMKGEGEAARVDRDLAIPMMHCAFEGGVNYVDTAVMYCKHDSERAVGEGLRGWRDRIIVSTKNHYYGTEEKEWWGNLENSLARLQTDHIDIYNHHGINWKSYTEQVAPRVGKWMRKAKDQGLIRHICTSFHDVPSALLKLVDAGYVEVITLQYNLLDRRLEDGIAYAHEKGLGVVVMGPVGGGRLGVRSDVFDGMLPQVKQVPELALRFVLSNPHVSLALSGMSALSQVEENLVVASDAVSLTEVDRTAIREHLARLERMAGLYCTGCGYCLPCESGVDIPGVFERYNVGRVYGLWKDSRKAYRWLQKGKKSGEVCTECGLCLDKCPQRLPIPELLKEAHAALSGT